MTAKLKNVAWGCLALVCGAASAQIRDGAYTGTLECGPLITNPQQGAWKQSININVTGKTVTWERPDPRITEVGSSILRDGRASFTLDGQWNPGQRNTGKWRNVAMLELKNGALSGPATIFSANGEQRLRDCSVLVVMAGASDIRGKLTELGCTLRIPAGYALHILWNPPLRPGRCAACLSSTCEGLGDAGAVPRGYGRWGCGRNVAACLPGRALGSWRRARWGPRGSCAWGTWRVTG